MRQLMFLAAVSILLAACATSPKATAEEVIRHDITTAPSTAEVSVSNDPAVNKITKITEQLRHQNEPIQMEAAAQDMQLRIYDEPPRLAHSLLNTDKVVLDEKAIKTILSSRVVLPKKGHLGIMKFPGYEGGATSYYGYDYWRSESYIKTQQEYVNTLSTEMLKSDRIVAVTLIPSLLAPYDATIPILREAAVRLQADLLLVFRITSDIYQQYKMDGIDEVKAFSTCEAVLLDIRTGLIPYTTLVTKESVQALKETDSDLNETRRRAEKEAIRSSLNIVSNELTEFLKSVP